MFRARRSLAGMVALGLLGVVAAGVAASGRQPDTDSVMATVVFSHVEGKTRSCEGVDGEYAEQFVTVTGTSTGDPRLSGKVTFSVYVIVNVENGVGTENGTIRIQDAQTGRTKVKAQAKDAGVGEIWQGLQSGRVSDRGSGGEATTGTGQIHANYRITFLPNGAVTMQIGGESADGRQPGVIFSGQCKGKYERFESDIPPPATVSARTRAAAPKVGWLR
jgi:hypothetical protein